MPERRLLIVTVDSCRLDIARRASTPFLDQHTTFHAARSHATFSLPAHYALFAGFVPMAIGGTGRDDHANAALETGRFPFRSHRGHSIGANLIDELRKQGVRTIGAGGVRWFESTRLRKGFDKFYYWSPEYTPGDGGLPEWHSTDYALSRPDQLASEVGSADNWLLFVNAAETHAPYMLTGELLDQQRMLAGIRNGKGPVPAWGGNLMSTLRDAQQTALSAVDRKLEKLCALLPGPIEILVCADHGEAFGESKMWGHVLGHDVVLDVPLWYGTVR